MAGLCLVMQIVTGVFLAMHYAAHVDVAFASIEHIMRDVNYGWLMRYAHANGASMFFVLVYIHMYRGLYYGSYMHPREHLWMSGVLLFILMMATAFLGYVLPWGQMSLWGATVITCLFSAIPYIGESITYWLWGGFSVSNATLNRFFSLHYLIPFLIAAVACVHLALLHVNGSNNPLGVDAGDTRIAFYPYFYVKDLFSFVLFMIVFSGFIFFAPNLLNHPDNYNMANALITPPHIVPEWYFLSFYAVLRSIPNKLGGVIAMAFALVVLFFLPYINSSAIRSSVFRPVYRTFFWLFVADTLVLGYIGQKVVDSPFIEIGQFATAYYFFFLLVVIPFFGYLEAYLLRLADSFASAAA